jgi:DNA-binding NarL/FixJ family response regulator
MKIVIADPDEASRKAVALLLKRRFGLTEVQEAKEVGALIQALAEENCDVILLDWRLYGAPAPETCRLLRKAYPNLRVVLLSIDPDDAEATEAVGAAFIHKGASPEEVIEILERMLEGPESDPNTY